MNDTNHDLRTLQSKVARLETCLEELNAKYQRSVNGLMGLHDVLNKHRKSMDAELNDALERIIHVELTLYPRLPKDMRHLYAVIGDQDTKAYNPLDFRDPSKKSR